MEYVSQQSHPKQNPSQPRKRTIHKRKNASPIKGPQDNQERKHRNLKQFQRSRPYSIDRNSHQTGKGQQQQ